MFFCKSGKGRKSRWYGQPLLKYCVYVFFVCFAISKSGYKLPFINNLPYQIIIIIIIIIIMIIIR